MAQSNFFWTTAGDGVWSAGGNWTNETGAAGGPGAAGRADYILNFNVPGTYTATHNLNNGFLLNRLSFGGATVTLAGNSLALTNSGAALPRLDQNGATDITISNSIALAAATTLGGTGAGAVTLSGAISGAGSLTKTNSGTLTLGGDVVNTWSGGTTVRGGTLALNQNRFNLGSGTVTLSDGTVFYTSNFEGDSSGGAITNAFTLRSGFATLWTAKDIWIAGPVSGSGGLLITGSGKASGVMLSRAKTFSGGVKLSPVMGATPTVSIDHIYSLGTGTLRSELTSTDLSAGNLRAAAIVMDPPGVTNRIDLAPGCRLVVDADGANNLWLAGAITNAGSLVKIGTAALTLSGANTYSGGTTISAGTLALGAGGSINNSTNISIAAGATLNLSAKASPYTLGASTALSASGTGTVAGATAAVINGPVGGTNDLGSQPISLTWGGASSGIDSTHPPLTVSQGTLALSGNTFSVVVPGTALGTGTYTLVTAPDGITGTVNSDPFYTGGNGIQSGTFGTIEVSGSTVILAVTSASAAQMSNVVFPGLGSAALGGSGTNFGITVPLATVVTNLAPTYTVSPGATGAPPSGTSRDFTGPQIYTVTAEDGSTKVYTVTVTKSAMSGAFYWVTAGPGAWSVGGNWTNETGVAGAPAAGGQPDYVLSFNVPGTYTATHDLNSGFLLNRLSFGGAAVTLAGNSLAFTNNGVALPQVNQNGATAVTISNSLTLAANVTFGGAGGTTLAGAISGAGGLTKTNSGTLTLGGAVVNTFKGGTTVSAGTLVLNQSQFNLGLGAVTLAGGTTFRTSGFEGNSADGALTNSFFLSGGNVTMDVGFGLDIPKDIWITGPVDGPGGFLITGSGRVQGLTLSGAKTFAGGVTLGTPGSTETPNVSIDNVASLGRGTLRSELKGTDLTSGGLRINNALTSGAGVTNSIAIASGARIVVDTWDAGANVKLSGTISGAGGSLIKAGPAALTLTGTNTFSGRTTIMAGTLVVSNRLALQNSTLVYTNGTTTFAGGITNFTLGGLSSSKPMGLINAAGAAIALTVGGNGDTTTNSGALSGTGSLTTVGPGTLTLSGTNIYSGATTVRSGTLRLTSTNALGGGTDVYLTSGGGKLRLDFSGAVVVHALYINGVRQAIKQYNAGNLPAFINGAGALFPLTGWYEGAFLMIR